MGVRGCCSWVGEPRAGDFGGVAVGFGDFLKNHDPDLLSEGCAEVGGGAVRVEDETARGCVVEVEEDCGEGVSS